MARPLELPCDYPPPGTEVRLIQRYASLEGQRVLEIGCGDGRLTRQFAPLAARVVAVEPSAEAVASARALTKAAGITNVDYQVASAEQLRLRTQPFDVGIFSWSL